MYNNIHQKEIPKYTKIDLLKKGFLNGNYWIESVHRYQKKFCPRIYITSVIMGHYKKNIPKRLEKFKDHHQVLLYFGNIQAILTGTIYAPSSVGVRLNKVSYRHDPRCSRRWSWIDAPWDCWLGHSIPFSNMYQRPHVARLILFRKNVRQPWVHH